VPGVEGDSSSSSFEHVEKEDSSEEGFVLLDTNVEGA
jgi:hypothetical protein